MPKFTLLVGSMLLENNFRSKRPKSDGKQNSCSKTHFLRQPVHSKIDKIRPQTGMKKPHLVHHLIDYSKIKEKYQNFPISF